MEAEVVTNQLKGEIQDFVAAYIFDNNLTKMPTVQERNVRVSNGMHKYFWIDDSPSGEIEHSYESIIPTAANRFAARTGIRPSIAVLRFKVETVRDGADIRNVTKSEYVRRSTVSREIIEAA